MRYKMVVFDLDGTILNTIEDLCSACNYALDKYSLSAISVESTKAYLGHGIRHLIREASNHSIFIEELLKEFKTYYSVHFNDATKPYPKIYEVLDWCKEHSIIIGVLTNKIEDIAKKLCEKHFNNYFSFVYGEVLGRTKKPDPKFFLDIIHEYSLEIKDVLYIGDSEVDIDLCNNAGVDGLFVSYGFRDKKELVLRSKQVVDTPQEIIKFLKR